MPEVAAQQVVVGLDASPVSGAVAAVAAELAARLGARLDAVYVEDAQWLAAAALPCARWVAGHTGAGQALTAEHVELIWRAAVTRLRATLAAEAGPGVARWSLEVVRGQAGPMLLSVGRAARVLAVGVRGWQGDGRRVGSVARVALDQCAGCLALVPADARRPRRWLAVLDTPASASAVVELAAALAAGGAAVEVLADPESAGIARHTFAGLVPGVLVQVAPPDALASSLRRVLATPVPTGLVLGRSSTLAQYPDIERLLTVGAAALLLVGDVLLGSADGPPDGRGEK